MNRLPAFRATLVAFALLIVAPFSHAAEAFLQPNDVIALVGGEDMAAAGEYGYLELSLTHALPEHRLKFRSLAREGDTAFEQPRDLNYPPLEQQLEEIGATVVIAQFGQMESLAGKEKLPEFVAAYDKLLERLSGGGKRRLALISQIVRESGEDFQNSKTLAGALRRVADSRGAAFIDLVPWFVEGLHEGSETRDGLHFDEGGHQLLAAAVATAIVNKATLPTSNSFEFLDSSAPARGKLLSLIRARNRLWFNYYRPQNWAFLAGDRTVQPSSRDHLDPSKRWFPEEMKQWLPLIEAREKEMWEVAGQLARP